MRSVPAAAHKSLRLGYLFERLHSPPFAGPSCCPYSCWLAGQPNNGLSGKGIEFWTARPGMSRSKAGTNKRSGFAAEMHIRHPLRSGFVWCNLDIGEVAASWFAFACQGTEILSFGLLSISHGIRLYPVEVMETSERVDGKKRQ